MVESGSASELHKDARFVYMVRRDMHQISCMLVLLMLENHLQTNGAQTSKPTSFSYIKKKEVNIYTYFNISQDRQSHFCVLGTKFRSDLWKPQIRNEKKIDGVGGW